MAEESTYILDETLAAVNSFYDFIIRMHADDDSITIRQPPESGWPDIEYEDFRKLGYNNRSIDLMRRLPYFGHAQGNRPMVMPHTWPINWVDPYNISQFKEYQPEPGDDSQAPAHIVKLMEAEEHGYTVYIDTDRGAVIWIKNDGNWPRDAPGGDLDSYAALAGLDDGDDADDDESDEDFDGEFDDWKYGRTFRIATFFEMCKRQFSSLAWIPRMEEGNQGTVMEMKGAGELSQNMAQRAQILRDSGWPGEEWKKDKAIRLTTERVHYYS